MVDQRRRALDRPPAHARRALGQKIPKGDVYFAMALSLGVELLNLRLRAKRKATAA